MDTQGDIEALRALARNEALRSKAGRIREIFDEIEATQHAGVSIKNILDTLNARGYDLTLKNFTAILYRIRKERAESSLRASHSQTSVSVENPIVPSHLDRPESSSSKKIANPLDIRRSRGRQIDLDEYTGSESDEGT